MPARILTLPSEVLELILQRLDWADVMRLRCVHPALRNAASSLQVPVADNNVEQCHVATSSCSLRSSRVEHAQRICNACVYCTWKAKSWADSRSHCRLQQLASRFRTPAALRDQIARRRKPKWQDADAPACKIVPRPGYSQREQLQRLAAFMRSDAAAMVSMHCCLSRISLRFLRIISVRSGIHCLARLI